MIMLDTCVVSRLLRKDSAMVNRFSNLNTREVCLSTIVVAELERWRTYAPMINHALSAFLRAVEIKVFDVAAATSFATLDKRLLKTQGCMDALVVSHAMSLELPLATTDTRLLQSGYEEVVDWSQ